MNIYEAFALGRPLAIEIDPNNRRIMAGLIPVPGGVRFADTYCLDAWGVHSYHTVDGTPQGEGPWNVGDARVFQIEHGDPLADAWNQWAIFLDSPPGKKYTRGSIEAAMKAES